MNEFEDEYLSSPTAVDMERVLRIYSARGFPCALVIFKVKNTSGAAARHSLRGNIRENKIIPQSCWRGEMKVSYCCG